MSNNQEPEYIAEEEESAQGNLQKIKKQLKQAEHERKEYLDGWQRERADFANYKRDTEKYIGESRTLIKADIILQFLEVLDNLELALKHMSQEAQKTDLLVGVEHIYKQFLDTLSRMDVQEIPALGHIFDPNLHEAFEQVEGGDEPEGTILEVTRKGYKIGERILRPANVRVAIGKKS